MIVETMTVMMVMDAVRAAKFSTLGSIALAVAGPSGAEQEKLFVRSVLKLSEGDAAALLRQKLLCDVC